MRAMQKTLTAAQRALVENNMALVGWYVDKRLPYCRAEDRDDLYQTGMLGLCRAALMYDPQQGARFTTYAMFYIAGDIRRWLRREHGRHTALRGIRLEDFKPGAEKGITIGDTIADREDGETLARLLSLREAIVQLEGRTGKVMRLYAAGYNQKEIARRLRTTQPTVCRSLQAGRAILSPHVN